MKFNRCLVFFFCFSLFSVKGFSQQNKAEIRTLIFQKTNALRKEKGLRPLVFLDSLQHLAQHHSKNMVKKQFYSHVDPAGKSPMDRAEQLGIFPWRKKGNRWIGIGENIAKVPWFENVSGCGNTQSSEAFAECMVQGWKNSPTHYKNIIGDYLHLGIGIEFDKEGTGFGTQVFR